jgi:hypothetical protein
MRIFLGWVAVRSFLPSAEQPQALRTVSGSFPDCQASKLRGISQLPSLRGGVRICCHTASPPASRFRPFDLRVFLLLMRRRPYSMMRAFLFTHPILGFLLPLVP